MDNLLFCKECEAPKKRCGTCKHWRPKAGEKSGWTICGHFYPTTSDLCAVRPNVKSTGELCGEDCDLYVPNSDTMEFLKENFNIAKLPIRTCGFDSDIDSTAIEWFKEVFVPNAGDTTIVILIFLYAKYGDPSNLSSDELSFLTQFKNRLKEKKDA